MGQSSTRRGKTAATKNRTPQAKRLESREDAPRTRFARAGFRPIEVMTQPPPGFLAGRIARIIRLIALLQSNDRSTVHMLANRLRVSRRTIFRDFKVLERAGVPFVNTPDGYVLSPEYRMAQLNLGVGETIGLMVLCKIAQAIPHQPMFGAAIEAVMKCLAQVPPQSRAVYEDLLRHVTYAPGFVNISEEDERRFCLLQQAIDDCLVCTMSYRPVDDHETVQIDIEPLHLHFYKHSWYVLAQSKQHGEVRMFKLARITNLKHTKHTFKPIEFSIEEHLDGAWGLIPGDRKYDVVIEFSPKVARNVAEIRWHASQESEMQPDGSCIMRFRVNGLDEMKWWLFSYADQAIVREPAELREKIRAMAQQTLDANGERADMPKR